MSVDISKIKIGDEVVARFKVGAVYKDGSVCTGIAGAWVPVSSVIEHMPAPLVFKAGDCVEAGIGTEVYTILAVHDDHAWIKPRGSSGFISPTCRLRFTEQPQ